MEVPIPKEKALGNSFAIPTKISPTKEYVNGSASDKVLGVTVSVIVPELNFTSISVKIPNHYVSEFPTNEEIQQHCLDLNFYTVEFTDFQAVMTLVDDREGKAYKKQAFIKYTASNAIIKANNDVLNIFGGDQ